MYRTALLCSTVFAASMPVAGCPDTSGGRDGASEIRETSADEAPDETTEVRVDSGDVGAEDTTADDAGPTCWGMPIRCGENCCTWYNQYDPDGRVCRRGDLVGWYDVGLHCFFIGRLTQPSDLPPLALDGWSWRGDGSEVLVVAFWRSCLADLDCINWCNTNGYITYVIDASTDSLLHSEWITLEERRVLDPWIEAHELSPVICPDLSIPDRRVLYGFQGFGTVVWSGADGSVEWLWRQLPVVPDAILVWQDEPRERMGSIDLYLPE